MIKMKWKIEFFFLAFLFLSISFSFSCVSRLNLPQESINIIQIPEGVEIEVGSTINLTIEFKDKSVVESVYLLYCSIEPEFYCHFPVILLNETLFNSFTVVFIPEYEIGTIMGYHFSLNYKNGTTNEIPNNVSFLKNGTNIRQAEDNQYYFELRIVKGFAHTNNQTSWFNISAVFFIVLVIFWKQSRKKNNF